MKLTNIQIKLCVIMLVNLYLGMTIIAVIQAYQEMFTYGLWHKIIIIFGSNIPIGMLSYILLGLFASFVIYTQVLFDYKVLKFGLDYINYIKVEPKSKPNTTNNILNDMENP